MTVFAILLSIILLAFLFVLLFLLWRIIIIVQHIVYTLRGSVFEPSSTSKVKTILALAQAQSEDKIIDLGSGDGELLLAFAQQGHHITGVEMNHLLLERSRRRLQRAGLAHLVTLHQASFLQMDLSEYDLLLVYCPTHVMDQLEPKLKAELKPGARVISNYFTFPTWQPVRVENEVRVYQQV